MGSGDKGMYVVFDGEGCEVAEVHSFVDGFHDYNEGVDIFFQHFIFLIFELSVFYL